MRSWEQRAKEAAKQQCYFYRGWSSGLGLRSGKWIPVILFSVSSSSKFFHIWNGSTASTTTTSTSNLRFNNNNSSSSRRQRRHYYKCNNITINNSSELKLVGVRRRQLQQQQQPRHRLSYKILSALPAVAPAEEESFWCKRFSVLTFICTHFYSNTLLVSFHQCSFLVPHGIFSLSISVECSVWGAARLDSHNPIFEGGVGNPRERLERVQANRTGIWLP